MSRLLGSPTRTHQPQYATGVDSGNPIADRLAFAYNGATCFDHAGQHLPTVYPSASKFFVFPFFGADAAEWHGEAGRLQNGTSDPGYFLSFQNRSLQSDSITLFVRFYAADTYEGTVFAVEDVAFSEGFEIALSSTNIRVWSADVATNWEETVGPAYDSDDVLSVAIVVKAGQPLELYTNKSAAMYSSASAFSNDGSKFHFILGSYSITGDGPFSGIVSCAFGWMRALSESEIRAVLANPWQVFASPRRLVIPVVVTAPNQLLAPASDVAAGVWTPSSGSDLYAMLDETVASDTDYIQTSAASICEIKFAAGATPATGGGTCRYRLLAGSGSITVRLKQGTTTLHTWGPHTLSGSVQDFAQTISATITDASNLRLELEAS